MTRQTLDTRAVHSGREDLAACGLHAAPLDFSTAYPAYDTGLEAARLDAFAAGELPEGRPIYGRVGNTTVARFERAIADLEVCAAAVAFSSGMAALTACLLASVAQGCRHIVAIRPLYGTSDHLLNSGLLGTTVTQHPYSLTHHIVADDDRRHSGISDRLLRLSVGLEDADDLWRDLDRSLSRAYEEVHP